MPAAQFCVFTRPPGDQELYQNQLLATSRWSSDCRAVRADGPVVSAGSAGFLEYLGITVGNSIGAGANNRRSDFNGSFVPAVTTRSCELNVRRFVFSVYLWRRFVCSEL